MIISRLIMAIQSSGIGSSTSHKSIGTPLIICDSNIFSNTIALIFILWTEKFFVYACRTRRQVEFSFQSSPPPGFMQQAVFFNNMSVLLSSGEFEPNSRLQQPLSWIFSLVLPFYKRLVILVASLEGDWS